MRAVPALVALALVGCAGESPAPVCAAGRVQSCPCPGGAAGAQECGPGGLAWGACVCPGDAGVDAGADVGDASSAGDVSAPDDGGRDAALVDGAPAPRLYQACDLGADCGAGLTCVAVPGVVRDAGAGRGVCTTTCAASAECAGHESQQAVCAMGACFIEATDPRTGVDVARWCAPWGLSRAESSSARPADSHSPNPTYTAFCAP